MRKVLFIFLYIIPIYVFSQDIKVANLSWWHPEYLTIVDCGTISMLKEVDSDKYKSVDTDIVENIRNNFAKMSDFDDLVQPYNVGLMWTLLLVDGQDAKGLQPSKFYELINEESKHIFTFELPSGEKTELNYISSNVPNFVGTLNIRKSERPNKVFNLGEIKKNAIGIDVLVDWSEDWSKYKTFDFAITSNDPLMDKEILSSFVETLNSYMTRDEVNPDVIITIARSSKNSISYSYVPPTTTYVKTGSTTKKVYSWLGMSSQYQTQDHLSTVHQDGYVQEINSSDIYLEISMLDSRKLDSKVPPVIYKATYQNSYAKRIDLLKELKYFAGAFGHPLDLKFSVTELAFDNSVPFAKRWGWASNNNIITHLYELGRFFNKGQMPDIGDTIISVNKKTSYSYSYRCDKVILKFKDTQGKKHSCELLYYAELDRFGGIRSSDFPLNEWSLDFYPYKMSITP